MRTPLLGAHVSSAGGVAEAIPRAVEAGIGACQIFVKNASQWRAKPLSESAADAFRRRRRKAGIERIVAHATYLVNLSATDPANRERSVATLSDELDRCSRLDLDGLVVHPGAHLGAGERIGLRRNARSLERVLERRADNAPPILLEITAGQGTVLGYRLEHLAEIIELCGEGEHLGVCLDTCHAFAAGYEIQRPEGLAGLLDEIDTLFGIDRLGCLHLNDSLHPLGSRRDRHAGIGVGEIGLEPFSWIVNESRLRHVPMILETPLGEDRQGHRRDLETLRGLLE